MVTIRAQLLHAGAALALSAPGADDLIVDVVREGPVRSVDVEKWPGAGIDQGDVAAQWLSDLLGRTVRLVREPARAARTTDPTA
jgi:uncharacterized protein YcbX